jgi:hypothetical protein
MTRHIAGEYGRDEVVSFAVVPPKGYWRSDTIRRIGDIPRLSARLTAQFVVLLALFAVSLVVVGGVAVWGLVQTRTSADRLYSDHLQTAQLTANVDQELDDTYETAQALLLAQNAGARSALTATLFNNDVPEVEVLLSDLQRSHAATHTIHKTSRPWCKHWSQGGPDSAQHGRRHRCSRRSRTRSPPRRS